VKGLFARNFSCAITEDEIRDGFQLLADGVKPARVRKRRDYAFIHFEKREDAELAFNAARDDPDKLRKSN
jgi:RNA recognition motif-containing protein